MCDSCGSQLVQRDDDKEEVISQRLKEYENQTLPLVDYYRRQGHLRRLNGELAVEPVSAEAFSVIEGSNTAGKR